MSEYEPTPARAFPILREPVSKHCPVCKLAVSDTAKLPLLLRDFCPRCLLKFLQKSVPILMETRTAQPVLPPAKAVTDRIEAMDPSPLMDSPFPDTAAYAASEARTVKMSLAPQSREIRRGNGQP